MSYGHFGTGRNFQWHSSVERPIHGMGKTLKQAEIFIQKTTIPSTVISYLLLGSAGLEHGTSSRKFFKLLKTSNLM